MKARLSIIIFGLLGVSVQVGCNKTDVPLDEYALVQLYPRNDAQLEAVHNFQDPEDQVEVLKRSRMLNDSLDVLVPPSKMGFIENFANSTDMKMELKNKHYGRILEDADRTPRRRVMREFNIHRYNSYATILEYIESMARRYHGLVTLQNLGMSYEGRPMKLVKISSKPGAGNPIIFVDGGIHAREWVAPAMALYLIHRLTADPEARQSDLNGVDWYILPVVNPDGYEYSRSSKNNRLWRKTRSQHVSDCLGVDGNRNYGFQWAVSGVSHNPCDKETYAGPQPFSEPETRMVRNIMMENKDRIKLYVSLHAYGQYLVYPWGYTGAYLPKDWKKLDLLARKVSDAVQRAGGSPFHVLSAGKWYAAAGGSDDYAFGAAGIPYSYTMELTEGYEFVYPESLLREILPQFYEGFRTFKSEIKREFGHRKLR